MLTGCTDRSEHTTNVGLLEDDDLDGFDRVLDEDDQDEDEVM